VYIISISLNNRRGDSSGQYLGNFAKKRKREKGKGGRGEEKKRRKKEIGKKGESWNKDTS